MLQLKIKKLLGLGTGSIFCLLCTAAVWCHSTKKNETKSAIETYNGTQGQKLNTTWMFNPGKYDGYGVTVQNGGGGDMSGNSTF